MLVRVRPERPARGRTRGGRRPHPGRAAGDRGPACERARGSSLCSHLGRPTGQDPETSLAPVSERLGELIGARVHQAPEVIGPEVRRGVARLEPGELLVLENTRWEQGETRNDPAACGGARGARRRIRQRRLRLPRTARTPRTSGSRSCFRPSPARCSNARSTTLEPHRRGPRAAARRRPRRRQGERQDRADRPLPRDRPTRS